jgi:hypothetical protein
MGNVCPRTGGGCGDADRAKIVAGGHYVITCAVAADAVLDDDVVDVAAIYLDSSVTAARDVVVLNPII